MRLTAEEEDEKGKREENGDDKDKDNHDMPQTEQDRSNGHGRDDHPCSGCTAMRVYLQRLADSDIAINSQKHSQPGVNKPYTVHERIEYDEDVTVDVVVSGPADKTK